MTTDSLQPAREPTREPSPEPAVDPSQPYLDPGPSGATPEDAVADQLEPSVFVDPTVPFTPHPTSNNDEPIDASAADTATPPSAPRHSPDELAVYETAVGEASSEPVLPESGADGVVEPRSESHAAALRGLALMDGEHIESSLNLNGDGAANRDALLLTDRRLIQIGAESQRSVSFMAVRDVDSASIATEPRGYGGYIWGVLSLSVAAMLWTIWDHPVGSFIAPIIVVLMGVYLVVDQVLSVGNLVAYFKAGSSVISVRLDDHVPSEELSDFLNRVFELKESRDGA